MSITSRRTFLQASGAVVAAACTAPQRIAAAPFSMPIGLQLYSVRDLLPKDFDGTLRQLKEAGYSVVEAAGFFDKSAKDFRRAMDRAGLRCISSHHGLSELQSQLDQWIDYGHTLGLEYIVVVGSRRRAPRSQREG